VQRVLRLADTLHALRPEVDLYLVAGAHRGSGGALTHRFRRVFRREDQLELHLSLLRRVSHLYDAPFFAAIQNHARRPVGVFHALPVGRGGSVVTSKWIRDLADFYGMNLLLAETSATSGGLDSLLAPTGAIKKAQDLAARAFGRSAPSSSPTARPRRTRSCIRRWWSRTTSCSSTATATSRTITRSC
jgi:arginine decarboxylase